MLPNCGQMGELLWFYAELGSSPTDRNNFVKRLKDCFLFAPTKAVRVLCVDHSEVVRTTEVTCKYGWGFMNSGFVAETTSLNHRKFSMSVEINSSIFFCLPSTLLTWQLKLPKKAELDCQDSSGDCCFHSLLSHVQRQHPEAKEKQVSVFLRVWIWKVFCE